APWAARPSRRTSRRCKASWTTSRPGSAPQTYRRCWDSRSRSLTTWPLRPMGTATTRTSRWRCPREERWCSAPGCASGGWTRWCAAPEEGHAQGRVAVRVHTHGAAALLRRLQAHALLAAPTARRSAVDSLLTHGFCPLTLPLEPCLRACRRRTAPHHAEEVSSHVDLSAYLFRFPYY